ncbi:hypothetical protein [Pseudophaeobacter sp.]
MSMTAFATVAAILLTPLNIASGAVSMPPRPRSCGPRRLIR